MKITERSQDERGAWRYSDAAEHSFAFELSSLASIALPELDEFLEDDSAWTTENAIANREALLTMRADALSHYRAGNWEAAKLAIQSAFAESRNIRLQRDAHPLYKKRNAERKRAEEMRKRSAEKRAIKKEDHDRVVEALRRAHGGLEPKIQDVADALGVNEKTVRRFREKLETKFGHSDS